MEIVHKKAIIKLNKEERDNLINIILLLEEMHNKIIGCDECPFKEECYKVSKDECLLNYLIQNINYINKNCE